MNADIDILKNIIAERDLVFIAEDGKKYDCCLMFAKPIQTSPDQFECYYQLLGHPQNVIRKAYGNDNLGAFISAIEKVNIELAYAFKGKFYYEGIDDPYLIIKDYRNV